MECEMWGYEIESAEDIVILDYDAYCINCGSTVNVILRSKF